MDLSKLSDDQLSIAMKVAKEAKRQGVNPDFVLPMVMAESGFDQGQTSKKGAIGVMQLMPDTAKGLKVDPSDIDQNIRGGVTLIKELVDNKNIGDDPHKVLMAYNAGPKTKFFETGNVQDLPDETLSHITKVSGFYGGELPKVSIGAQRDEEEPTQEKPAEPASTAEVPAIGSTEIPGEKAALGTVGAYTGAKVAGGIETGKKAVPILQTLYDKATGSDAFMHRPQSAASLQRYANSQLGHDLRVPLAELEKIQGKPIRTMSEVQDAIKSIQAQPRTAKVASVNPQTGQPRKIFTAPKPAVDLTQFKHTPTMATRAADEAARGVELVKGALPSAGRIGLGALGGANAAMSGYDAYKLYEKEGFTPRVASKMAATVGGGLSMLPFGVTQVIGAGLQAPELAWTGYDYLTKDGE
ncbi:transglycosylase slt domain [Caudoviricetes sp.]|nr:transglycosylase slt domain [Caudoviricetes sp.]